MNILSKAGKIVTIVLAALGFAGAMPADAQTSIIWQSTWTLCSGTYCPGWAPWESDSQTEYIVVSDSGVVYNLTWSGQVRSSGPTTPAWTLMSSSSDIDQIDARGGVYQVHNSGEVDRWVTSSGSHPQWKKIDKRSNIWQIAAGAPAQDGRNSTTIRSACGSLPATTLSIKCTVTDRSGSTREHPAKPVFAAAGRCSTTTAQPSGSRREATTFIRCMALMSPFSEMKERRE